MICRNIWEKKKPRKTECPTCEKPFRTTNDLQIYCCRRCGRRAEYLRRVERDMERMQQVEMIRNG
jgi:predicted amidophosphoribosyltransferase